MEHSEISELYIIPKKPIILVKNETSYGWVTGFQPVTVALVQLKKDIEESVPQQQKNMFWLTLSKKVLFAVIQKNPLSMRVTVERGYLDRVETTEEDLYKNRLIREVFPDNMVHAISYILYRIAVDSENRPRACSW